MDLSKSLPGNNTSLKEAYVDHMRRMGFPKRVILHPDQRHRERWERYFEDQYVSECAKLGIEPKPLQQILI